MNESDFVDVMDTQHEADFDRVDKNDDGGIDPVEEQRMDIPLYVAMAPLALSLIISASIQTMLVAVKQPQKVNARLNLSRVVSTSRRFLASGEGEEDCMGAIDNAPPPDAEDLVLVVKRRQKDPPSFVFCWGIVLELATIFGFHAAVGANFNNELLGERGFVQHVPTYERTNPATLNWMLAWCAVGQCLVVVFGAVIAMLVAHLMRPQLAALQRLATGITPRLSFRHAPNVVAWCRLRDEIMQNNTVNNRKAFLTMLTTISASWALLGSVALGCLRLSDAPVTRFYVTCGWFAIVGGLVSLFQLASIASIDAAIERHRAMLQEQLVINAQVAGTFDATDIEQRSLVAADLRAASAVIQGELDAYDTSPESRYFYIFGFRVKTVMHTVGLVLLSQAGTVAAFGWNYIAPEEEALDLAGSA
jgi:hypothetical protein